MEGLGIWRLAFTDILLLAISRLAKPPAKISILIKGEAVNVEDREQLVRRSRRSRPNRALAADSPVAVLLK